MAGGARLGTGELFVAGHRVALIAVTFGPGDLQRLGGGRVSGLRERNRRGRRGQEDHGAEGEPQEAWGAIALGAEA